MTASRREFVIAAGAGAGALAAPRAAAAASAAPHGEPQIVLSFDPHDPALRYDLVVTGGTVIDPASKLHAKRDIGIKNGQIAAVAPTIDPTRGIQTFDARGLYLAPGLIDLHCHYFHQVSGIGLPADELMPLTLTTTGVDAGDAGYSTFSGFRHFIAAQARTRLFAFIHISAIGLTGDPIAIGELFNIDYAQVDKCAKAVAENRDMVLGVKVRMSRNTVGENGAEALRRSIHAAEIAGSWARVMVHIGDCPIPLSDLLAAMRPGDIITHCYSGANGRNRIVENGRVLPAALEAQRRGVLFDVGHGGGSFDFTIAQAAMAQGLMPTTISSDVHSVSINTPGKPLFPWVLSKFLALGLSLDDAIARATVAPAKIIGRVAGLGTLAVGAPADVAIFRLVDAPVTFVDTNKNEKSGHLTIEPVKTIRQGRPTGFPYPNPFTYT